MQPRRSRSSTLERYRGHLVHFAHYLASVHTSDSYKANQKQVGSS
jgi:hypothetical protein